MKKKVKRDLESLFDVAIEDCSQYWAVIRFKRFVKGDFEVLANFGQGTDPGRHLVCLLKDARVLGMMFAPNLVMTVYFDGLLPAGAVCRAVLRAQDAGILPRAVNDGD